MAFPSPGGEWCYNHSTESMKDNQCFPYIFIQVVRLDTKKYTHIVANPVDPDKLKY